MNTKKIKVKWGTTVILITSITSIIIIIAEYYLLKSLLSSMDIITLIIAIIIVVILGYFALEAPLSLELDEHKLVLYKIKGKLIIEFDQIAHIDIYIPDCSDIRLFGSGGFCGFIGKFRNKNIGNYQSYVGDYAQSFLIQTKKNVNYVLSCENREEVINIVKQHIK